MIIMNIIKGKFLVSHVRIKNDIDGCYNLCKPIIQRRRINIGNIFCSNLNNYKFYSSKAYVEDSSSSLKNTNPILSLRDIVEYKKGKIKTKPYQGLLKGKEESYFKLGKPKLYPETSEYGNFEDICDWKSRIIKIIKEELKPGCTYDIAVIGRDILNEEYITYGKHFLINSESNINAVITRIEGNILINSISLNSGEIGVAENNNDLDSGFRLIVFSIRAVSFEEKVNKIANKILISNTKSASKITKSINKKELFKLRF